MERKSKKYCPRCHERMRHAARRCRVCGTLRPLLPDYFVIALLALIFAALLLRFYL